LDVPKLYSNGGIFMRIKLDQAQRELIEKKTGVSLDEINVSEEKSAWFTTMAIGEEDGWWFK
jgi:hypothetical protein